MNDTTPLTRSVPDAAGRPTPRWWGPAVSLLLLASALWFFAYALLDIAWMQSLGSWNYLIATGFALVMVLMMRSWRGDPKDGWEPGPSYAEQVRASILDTWGFVKKVFSRY